ncbi:MAG: TIGR01777 family oxidoreductase [Acidobacteriaceae bacterium]
MNTIFPQVLISGASGLVGNALCGRMHSQGVPCARLVRKAHSSLATYRWDPYCFEFRDEMRRLNGIRAAINLSGETLIGSRWTKEKKQKIRESRVCTTSSMVELLSRLERRPEVFICASAIGYYGDRGDDLLDESSASGDGFLADVCREWEASAAAASQLGIRVVNLRFGVILSAIGGALATMLRVFRLGVGGRLGSGRQWMSWISLPDVLRAIEFCMENAEIQGPVNVVAPQPVSNMEFTQALGTHLRRPAIVPVPTPVLRLVFGEMADATLLSSTRVIPNRLQRSSFAFHHPTLPQAFQAVLPN